MLVQVPPGKTQAVCCSSVAAFLCGHQGRVQEKCGSRLSCLLPPTPAALLKALGLAVRGVRQEASPLLSSQLSFVAASSKHNQIGNLHPSFLLHLAPCSAPTGA